MVERPTVNRMVPGSIPGPGATLMLNNFIAVKEIGTFQIISGKVRATDPCYDLETWCAGTVENVLPGEYVASVVTTKDEIFNLESDRVGELFAIHKNYINKQLAFYELDLRCCVDSGQFGFFDLDKYPKILGDKRYNDMVWNEFYREKICPLTCDMTGDRGIRDGGTIDFGCVSSSGYGDGGYPVFAAYNDEGKVIALKAEFIDDSEEIEEEVESESIKV